MNTINKSIGFIGGGRVTRIMLGGFSHADVLPKDIVVAEPNDDVFQKLSASLPSVKVVRTDNKAAARQDIVFGALHPPAIPTVLAEIAPALCPDAIFISLAPKATIANLSQGLQGFKRIARLLPNAPSIVNQGYNPIAFSDGLSPSERSDLLAFLRSLGECPEVAEDKIEAYAILVAMGPTYFWFQWQQLVKLGLSFGMDQAEAGTALAAMLNGATATMFMGGMAPEDVLDLVPVKPLGEDEPAICEIYTQRLEPLFRKLKS